MEKGRISLFQMAMIMFPTVTVTAILTLPSNTASLAGRDMWISPIWGMLSGVITLWLAFQLNRLSPGDTIIQICPKIVGKPLGKAIGLLYLLFYLHLLSLKLEEYGFFIKSNFYAQTPVIIMVISFTLLCAYCARGGVEVIGRSAMFFIPVGTFMLAGTIFLIFPETRLDRMQPIMEFGLGPSWVGSIPAHGYFSEFFLTSFLLPFVQNREQAMKPALMIIGVSALLIMFINFISLLTIGDQTAYYLYPLISVARGISVLGFFEHLESFIMILWVSASFIKMSMFMYALLLGTAQWCNLDDFRRLALPASFLIIAVSQWGDPRHQTLHQLITTILPFYLLSMHIVLPALLLLIAKIRRMPA